MFNPFDTEDTALDKAIASAFADLTTDRADSDEYQKTLDQISKLYALKNQTAELSLKAQTEFAANQLANDIRVHQDELDERPFYLRVDPNTVLTVLGNIAIGLAVIKYEQTGVISSKVMSFMKKI